MPIQMCQTPSRTNDRILVPDVPSPSCDVHRRAVANDHGLAVDVDEPAMLRIEIEQQRVRDGEVVRCARAGRGDGQRPVRAVAEIDELRAAELERARRAIGGEREALLDVCGDARRGLPGARPT